MYTLSVEQSFASAHQLRGYKGKCENLHGHNWKVVLTVCGTELNEIGILIDFHEVKDALKSIIEEMDHTFLNDLAAFKEHNPSSENIARYIYQKTVRRFAAQNITGASVQSVTVYESETSRCTYSE
jgi:6-pyruvoyltetrahydropterin/6-carboxytetrahydropterin synthase